jgi:hypothetical protein
VQKAAYQAGKTGKNPLGKEDPTLSKTLKSASTEVFRSLLEDNKLQWADDCVLCCGHRNGLRGLG